MEKLSKLQKLIKLREERELQELKKLRVEYNPNEQRLPDRIVEQQNAKKDRKEFMVGPTPYEREHGLNPYKEVVAPIEEEESIVLNRRQQRIVNMSYEEAQAEMLKRHSGKALGRRKFFKYDFAGWVRRECKELEVAYSEIADVANLKLTTVKGIVYKMKSPSLEDAGKIANALGYRLDAVLTVIIEREMVENDKID